MSRFQEERQHIRTNHKLNYSYWGLLNKYILNSDILNKMKETSIILHLLPRNDEIDVSVDSCKQAKYFEQIKMEFMLVWQIYI